MSDIKSIKKQLNRLENEHYELDRIILHMNAQKFDSEIKSDPMEINKLKDLQKRKVSIHEEIIRLKHQLQNWRD
tara:strand:+ start:193 stop:414 length:222 start_codon:yes stop_codon:yes gene_type:complete